MEIYEEIEEIRKDIEVLQVLINSRFNRINDRLVMLRNRLKMKEENNDRTERVPEASD